MHELSLRPRRLLVSGIAFALLLGGIMYEVGIFGSTASVPIEHIHIAPALGASTVKELADLADAIVLVEVKGISEARWNSTDGRRWGEPGMTSFIYRDTPVSVVRLIRGVAPPAFSLRLVGGVADGVDMDFEAGGPEVTLGDHYLVFLERLDFPTQGGTEASWTAVRLAQGMYRRVSGGWFDDVQQLTVRDTDLSVLSE